MIFTRQIKKLIMKMFYTSIIYLLFFTYTLPCYSQLDLSLKWETQEDLSYFDADSLNNILNNELSQLSNLDGIIVIHHGKIVAEQYYNKSSISDIFNIFSVTKSYTSTLIGQAIDQGLINGPDSTLDTFFPDFTSNYLHLVKLKHLLSMTSGYTDNYNYPLWNYATTQELINMPHSSRPGSFKYNNSACHLHSHIIYVNTGKTPKEFANIHLFPFLGINNPKWLEGVNNINDGAASLELNLRDMVKLGQLFMQDGYSGNNKIISSEWIAEATSPKVNGWNGYGYLWWLQDKGYSAIGYGGQYITVIPDYNLLIGTHSNLNTGNDDNYNNTLQNYIQNKIAPLFDHAATNTNEDTKIIKDFKLLQNYPNPFNPSTTIAFQLPNSQNLAIKIYNMNGQLVDILYNGWQQTGYHEFIFDGQNLSSGIYIYELKTDHLSHYKKMILIK